MVWNAPSPAALLFWVPKTVMMCIYTLRVCVCVCVFVSTDACECDFPRVWNTLSIVFMNWDPWSAYLYIHMYGYTDMSIQTYPYICERWQVDTLRGQTVCFWPCRSQLQCVIPFRRVAVCDRQCVAVLCSVCSQCVAVWCSVCWKCVAVFCSVNFPWSETRHLLPLFFFDTKNNDNICIHFVCMRVCCVFMSICVCECELLMVCNAPLPAALLCFGTKHYDDMYTHMVCMCVCVCLCACANVTVWRRCRRLQTVVYHHVCVSITTSVCIKMVIDGSWDCRLSPRDRLSP